MNKIENLISRLSKVRRKKNGFISLCPVHNEKTPSLNITIKDDKILLKCFGLNCKPEEIVKDLGLEMSDLFLTSEEKENLEMIMPVRAKSKKYNSVEEVKSQFKNLEDCYEYFWLNDLLPSHLQIRYRDIDNHKQFATYHREGEFFYEGRGDGLVPLYNLKEVNDAKSVLVVEGEKLVKLMKEVGITATCSLGGANNAESADWTPLMKKPSIVMWRDFNEAGLKYQNDVDRILGNLGINLRKVEVEKLGLNEGDDLEQYIEMNPGSSAHIRGKIYSCIPKINKASYPVNYLKTHLEKVKAGDIKNWDVPFFPLLTQFARSFKPGSQTVIVSAGGVGKSLFAGRTSDELVLNQNAKIKRLHLESNMSFYLLRSLAQQSQRVEVMNEEFHYNNPRASDSLVDEYEDTLNTIGKTITTSDSGLKRKITDWNDDSIIRWMTDNADADIIIVDPVSMVLDTGNPWITSTKLLKHGEELLSKNERLCIVWINHTAESGAQGNTGGIAGGKAWNKYSSSILEMIFLEDPDVYEISPDNTDNTIITKEVQTYIRVKKARNGAGANWKIAMELDKTDLTYKEIGRMMRKLKK